MITRKPYFKETTRYVSFRFDTEQEATVFREYCDMMGMKTDKDSYSGNYKTVVYIFVDHHS